MHAEYPLYVIGRVPPTITAFSVSAGGRTPKD
jgi:hypothetical protein